MKLERNLLRSVIFGLGLSKEVIELHSNTIKHSGLIHRLGFWRIDAVNRHVWLSDVHAIGIRTCVYPILMIFAAISGINIVANLAGWELYWDYPIWKMPYGFVLAWLFMLIYETDTQFLVTHIICFLIYVFLSWATRRKVIQIDYGDSSPIRFSVAGIDSESVNAFMSALRNHWERKKSEQ